MACPVLIDVTSTNCSKEIPITSNKFLIGRGLQNGLVISNINISRTHCIIEHSNNHWSILDKSVNGTFVNGRLLEKRKGYCLTSGDIISMSRDVKFVFRIPMYDSQPLNDGPQESLSETGLSENNPTIIDEILVSDDEIMEITESVVDYIRCDTRSELSPEFTIEHYEEVETSDNIQNEHEEVETSNNVQNEYEEVEIFDDTQNEHEEVEILDDIQNEHEEVEIFDDIQNEHEEVEIFDDIQNEHEEVETSNDIKNEVCQLLTTLKEGLEPKPEVETSNNIQNEHEEVETFNNIQNEHEEVETFNNIQNENEEVETFNDIQNEHEEVETFNNIQNENEEVETFDDIKNDVYRLLATFNSLKPKPVPTEKDSNLDCAQDELQCAICTEMFIHAVTLSCSHSYCNYCLTQWRKKRSYCPICRAEITKAYRTRVIDSFIAKILENASEEIKQHRREIIAEREAPTSTSSSSNEQPISDLPSSSTNNTRRRAAEDPIEISSEEGSEAGELSENWEYDDDDDFSVSDYNGLPGHYYGGYGQCYSCNERGHWANGCPHKRRR